MAINYGSYLPNPNQGLQVASGLASLDQARLQNQQVRKQKEAQAAQQARIKELLPMVQAGDYDATIEMTSISPELGQAIQTAKTNMQEGQDRATAQWIAGYQAAPDKDAYLSQDNPSIDIDDQFRDMPIEQREVLTKIVGSQVMPRQMFEATFTGSGSAKPTANIQDFQYYEELKKTNPAAAEQFAMQVGINQKPESAVKPTTAIQNFEKWNSMTDGPEKVAFGRSIGLSPKENPKEARLQAQEVDLLSSKVQSASDTVQTINEILGDKSLGDMVGLPSAFPTLPGSDVANLEAKVEQFRNQLTLENLDKMSGVLTDRDIQVLASAASGLETSMSPSAFKAQLNKIKATLNRGIKQNQKKLEDKGVSAQSESTEEVGDQGQSYSEGTVIRNPQTGEQMILQGGQWVGYNG